MGGSIGNSIFSKSKIAILLGMGSIVLFTILPFIYEVDTPFFRTSHKDASEGFQFLYYASLILGCLLLAMQFFHLLRLTIPKKAMAKRAWLARLFTPEIAYTESKIKQAASLKVKMMLQNATAIHQSDESTTYRSPRMETSYGRALLNFAKHSDEREPAGGLLWTWRRVWNGTLYSEQGVFLNSQVMAGNAAQIIVCVFICVAGVALVVAESQYEVVDDGFLSEYVPKRWMILLATLVGLACGLLASIHTTLLYVPSSVSTILKFRSGVIPSLRDTSFTNYRSSEDQIALLFGSIFWGAFYTSLAIAVLIGAVIFFAVWQVTSPYFWAILANIIGLSVTVGLKYIVLMLLRKHYHAAFYRKKPAQSNVLNVVLECWNVGLATGYVLARASMLLLAAALHIGRVDVPFLAPDVAQIGPLQMDTYPTAYRKALLSSEAHRHPLIERLGSMYMMKLRYGKGFARTSGSIWRLLFVFALMPWLRKYRILARPELQNEDDDDDEDYSDFKFVKKRRMLAGPRRRQSGTKTNGTSKEEMDSAKDENKALEHENERLQLEVVSLRKKHEELLQSMNLVNDESP